MSNSREVLTGWEAIPTKDMNKLRAIAEMSGGTTIQGVLTYYVAQYPLTGKPVERLEFVGVKHPIIENYVNTGNKLTRSVRTIKIFKRQDKHRTDGRAAMIGAEADLAHCAECGRSVCEVGLMYNERVSRFTDGALCGECLKRLERDGYMEAMF